MIATLIIFAISLLAAMIGGFFMGLYAAKQNQPAQQTAQPKHRLRPSLRNPLRTIVPGGYRDYVSKEGLLQPVKPKSE